jgi:hypothetical protein
VQCSAVQSPLCFAVAAAMLGFAPDRQTPMTILSWLGCSIPPPLPPGPPTHQVVADLAVSALRPDEGLLGEGCVGARDASMHAAFIFLKRVSPVHAPERGKVMHR